MAPRKDNKCYSARFTRLLIRRPTFEISERNSRVGAMLLFCFVRVLLDGEGAAEDLVDFFPVFLVLPVAMSE